MIIVVVLYKVDKAASATPLVFMRQLRPQALPFPAQVGGGGSSGEGSAAADGGGRAGGGIIYFTWKLTIHTDCFFYVHFILC